MKDHGLVTDTKTKRVALSNTHLKMYGQGAEIDEIRENATIDVSIDIS